MKFYLDVRKNEVEQIAATQMMDLGSIRLSDIMTKKRDNHRKTPQQWDIKRTNKGNTYPKTAKPKIEPVEMNLSLLGGQGQGF